jgi:hypothetical protein
MMCWNPYVIANQLIVETHVDSLQTPTQVEAAEQFVHDTAARSSQQASSNLRSLELALRDASSSAEVSNLQSLLCTPYENVCKVTGMFEKPCVQLLKLYTLPV